jgi:2-dehydropantoate 2-reductase
MRIAIVGAGALGLYYGAMLQRAGNDVHFILRRDYEAIKADGLRVFSVHGDFHLENVNGYKNASEIGEVDLVLVGLKTFANHMFEVLISPLLGKRTAILTLQNGLGNEEALAELFGADRIMGGVAFLCANRGEPGVVHHLGEGKIIIGDFNNFKTVKTEKLAELFQKAAVPCTAVRELKKARWQKLVWNIPFNGICALMLKPVDALLRHSATRKLVIDIMGEVIEAGNAQGIEDKLEQSLAEKLITFSEGLGSYKPSMLIDRLERRQLELEAIFKIPLSEAMKKGVFMPKVEELYALLNLSETHNQV